MDLRTRACFALSRALMRPPEERTAQLDAYGEWRSESLARAWSSFPDSHAQGKDVLDFGCGGGHMVFYLAARKQPRSVIGVDVDPLALEWARRSREALQLPSGVPVELLQGSPTRIPLPDASVDTLLAFDCLEHVMEPATIVREWYRVLRPGGRVLIEWAPFKGPWGAHMESLIPIPWAHVIFGERAVFRTARRIYDLPGFTPRHWDLDPQGRKKPNKWLAWESFADQGFVNQLDLASFRRLAGDAGFLIARWELRGFGGAAARRLLGRSLSRLPFVGEYFVTFAVIEIER